jgi:hypothetical protein
MNLEAVCWQENSLLVYFFCASGKKIDRRLHFVKPREKDVRSLLVFLLRVGWISIAER